MKDPSVSGFDPGAEIPKRGDAELARFLAELISRREVTAAAALVAGVGDSPRWGAAGRGSGGGSVGRESLFDLASLTKPLMATLALVLDQEDRVPLALPVGAVFRAARPSLISRPLSALLRHASDFQSWMPLYALASRRPEVVELLQSERAGGESRGVYSDLDFILWGVAVEELCGESIDHLLADRVLSRLAPDALTVSRRPDRAKVVRCWLDGAKEGELAAAQGIEVDPAPAPPLGSPQDGNARFLASIGTAPAHAGLFASIDGVLAIAREWLAPGRLLATQAVAAALRGSGPLALGWMRRRVRGAAGSSLTPRAFGHTGFTGGSVWIDPGAGSIHVLLAHRTSHQVDMNAIRRRFHRAFPLAAS